MTKYASKFLCKEPIDGPNVRRVAISLTPLGLLFTRNTVSVFADAAEMQRINPIVRIPSLILDSAACETLPAFIAARTAPDETMPSGAWPAAPRQSTGLLGTGS
jgi:glutathione S-transferase